MSVDFLFCENVCVTGCSFTQRHTDISRSVFNEKSVLNYNNVHFSPFDLSLTYGSGPNSGEEL